MHASHLSLQAGTTQSRFVRSQFDNNGYLTSITSIKKKNKYECHVVYDHLSSAPMLKVKALFLHMLFNDAYLTEEVI
jgi:hypothetical protein